LRFRGGYYLIRGWLRIVFRHAGIALMKYASDHLDWHALIRQLRSEGMPPMPHVEVPTANRRHFSNDVAA
jgi:hypothetical protein